jgi:hypothetical protein
LGGGFLKMKLTPCKPANYVASRYLLIGHNGTGKTRFAGTFPGKTLWIDIEGRIDVGVKEGDMSQRCDTIAEVEEVIKYLEDDNFSQGHFQNVVLDSWSQFYLLHQEATKKKYAEDANSYKKWEKLNTTLFELNARFQGLKDKGLNVILTASGHFKTDEVGNPFFTLANHREQVVFALVDNIFLFTNEEKEGYKMSFRFSAKAVPPKTLPPINEKYPKGSIDPTDGFEKLIAPHLYTTEQYESERAYHAQQAEEAGDRKEKFDLITGAVKAKKVKPSDINAAKEKIGVGSAKLHELTLNEMTSIAKELKL